MRAVLVQNGQLEVTIGRRRGDIHPLHIKICHGKL